MSPALRLWSAVSWWLVPLAILVLGAVDLAQPGLMFSLFPGPAAAHAGFLLLVTVPLCWRFRAPATVAIVVTVAAAAWNLWLVWFMSRMVAEPPIEPFLAMLVAVFALASRVDGRRLWVAASITGGLYLAMEIMWERAGKGTGTMLSDVAAYVLFFVIGRTVHAERQQDHQPDRPSLMMPDGQDQDRDGTVDQGAAGMNPALRLWSAVSRWLLPLAILVLGAVDLAQPGLMFSLFPGPAAAHAGFLLLVTVPLYWRFRAPATVAIVVTVAAAAWNLWLVWDLGLPMAAMVAQPPIEPFLAMLVAVFALASRVDGWRLWVAASIAGGLYLAMEIMWERAGKGTGNMLSDVALYVLFFVIGRTVHAERQQDHQPDRPSLMMPDGQDQGRDGAVDRGSAGVAPAPDRVEQHSAKSSIPSQEAQRQKTVLILQKGWRPLIFFVIAAVALLVGVYYKSLANPGTEGNFLAKPPALFDVYVSDPRISVQVSDTVAGIPVQVSDTVAGSIGDATSVINVQVHVPPGLAQFSVFMLSSAQEPGLTELHQPPNDTPESLLEQQDGLPCYGGAFSFSVKKTQQRTVVFHFDQTDIPAVVGQAKDATYGNLPGIGLQDTPNTFPPNNTILLAERYANSTQYRDVTLNPLSKIPTATPAVIPSTVTPAPTINPTASNNANLNLNEMGNPADYKTPHGGRGDLYWAPENLSITEELVYAAHFLQTETVKNISPTGTMQGPNYVWRNTGSLEPTFETTIESAANNESNSAFLSGIFFGVAGAAVIALVQEFPEAVMSSRPDWLPTFKRRRRRTTSSLTSIVQGS